MRWPPSTLGSRSRGGTGVRWADARFAHRFAGAPAPQKPPRTGPRTRPASDANGFDTCSHGPREPSLLGLGILVVGDLDRTQALASMAALWTLILAIDFVISLSYTLWPRVPKPSSTARS